MPGHGWLIWGFILLYSLEGKKSESLALLRDFLAHPENLAYTWHDTVSIWRFADVYVLCGETDEALRWLEHGL